MSNFDEKRWLEERKAALTLDWRAYDKSPCIFSPSTALLKECEYAYVPQFVSIGPHHFGKAWFSPNERFKAEAASRELERIKEKTNNSVSNFDQVVEKIRSKEEEIKRCYDKGTPFKGEVLLWMMAGDACFILEFFRDHLCRLNNDNDDGHDVDYFRQECRLAPGLHPIFGPESENPGVKSEIMKDLIKLDNQIPLFIVEDVLAMEMMDSPDRAKAELDKLLRTMFQKFYYRPFKFCAEGKSSKRNHILDIYHYSCLGVEAPENKNENENDLNLCVCCFCFAGSDSVTCSCFARGPQQSGNLLNNIQRERPNPKRRKEWWLSILSAVQLKNGGVKFQIDGQKVDDINFQGKILTLVPLKLDVDSEVYIRNLIGLDICSPDYKHKRMTAYCQFMYELCQSDKGVDVMRKNGVIIGNLWHSGQVNRLLSVSNLTISQPARKSIQETRENLSSCYKTHPSIVYRSLWNEFLKAYGSKPWLVVGGFGATMVLFLTAIQVFCLFIHCGPRSK